MRYTSFVTLGSELVNENSWKNTFRSSVSVLVELVDSNVATVKAECSLLTDYVTHYSETCCQPQIATRIKHVSDLSLTYYPVHQMDVAM